MCRIGNIDFTIAVGVSYSKLFFGKEFQFGKMSLNGYNVRNINVSDEISIADFVKRKIVFMSISLLGYPSFAFG